MRILFVADLHYTLRQFDWLSANAGDYDLVMIGGDLLDLGSRAGFRRADCRRRKISEPDPAEDPVAGELGKP
jgi:Icc-related predicted phosphoesterase